MGVVDVEARRMGCLGFLLCCAGALVGSWYLAGSMTSWTGPAAVVLLVLGALLFFMGLPALGGPRQKKE